MNFKEGKERLIGRIENLSKFAMVDEDLNSNLQALKEDLQRELQFNVLCTGEFSAGKSTFVNNFFIKKPILPTKATETTAKLTFVKYGEEEKVKIHFLNGKVEVLKGVEKGILENYLAKNGDKIKEVDFVEVFINSPVLKDGVTIIDSPGLNAPENERVNLTYDYIPKADAVLYLLSAMQPWKGSEKDFLENKILKKEDLDKVFLILNYWDAIEPEEREEVLEYVKEQRDKSIQIVKRELGEVSTPPVIPISAKKGCNFDQLEKELISYLSSKKGNEILRQKEEKFELLKKKVLKLLEKKATLYLKNREELEKEKRKVEEELEKLKVEALKYKKHLYPKIEKIIDRWLMEIEGLYQEFGNNVISKIENLKVSDPKELESKIKKIIIFYNNHFQKKLNNLNKKLVKQVEKLAEEEKAQFELEEVFLKKEIDDFYTIQEEIKTGISGSIGESMLPMALTGGGVGATLFLATAGTNAVMAGILGLPLVGLAAFFIFQKDKEKIEEAKENIGEQIGGFIASKIEEVASKKEEIIENIIDSVKNEIVKAFEKKQKEYETIIQKLDPSSNKQQIEEINKLKKQIQNI